jgi:hypothetical protein
MKQLVDLVETAGLCPLRELLDLPQRREDALAAEAAETVGHVGRVADLAHLAVVDDVDPSLHLTSDDLVHSVALLCVELGGVGTLTADKPDQHLPKLWRTRQAAGVGAQDSLVRTLHLPTSSLRILVHANLATATRDDQAARLRIGAGRVAPVPT